MKEIELIIRYYAITKKLTVEYAIITGNMKAIDILICYKHPRMNTAFVSGNGKTLKEAIRHANTKDFL